MGQIHSCIRGKDSVNKNYTNPIYQREDFECNDARESDTSDLQENTGITKEDVALWAFDKFFFDGDLTNLNCPVERFVAFDGANKLDFVELLNGSELFPVGNHIRISNKMKLNRRFRSGVYISGSVSHNGILSICSEYKGFWSVELTDLIREKVCEFDVKGDSTTGFYDSYMVLITYGVKLRECCVDEMFDKNGEAVFTLLSTTEDASPYTDVSLLHSTRVLYYKSTNSVLNVFDVDTRRNTVLFESLNVYSVANSTGIQSCFVCLIHCNDAEKEICGVGEKQELIPVLSCDSKNVLTTVFHRPKESQYHETPVVIFHDSSICVVDGGETSHIKEFDDMRMRSVIRIFRDIFILFDSATDSWVALRICVN